LQSCRAICDRMSSRVDALNTGARGQHDGRELFRLFLIELFSENYKPAAGKSAQLVFSKLNCRHEDPGFRPVGTSQCVSAGTLEAGKASGFVMSDFRRNKLRPWLKSKIPLQGDAFLGVSSDDEDMKDEELDGLEADDSDHRLQPQVPTSDFDADGFPSSQPYKLDKDGNRVASRVSTKARVCMLSYLHSRSGTPEEFKEAWRALVRTKDPLVHLCGCGLGWKTDKATFVGCCKGDHLKLASQELNLEHTKVHFALGLAKTSKGYQGMLKGIRESADFDDVF